MSVSKSDMNDYPEPLDLRKIKVFPLKDRQSLSSIETVLIDPASSTAPVGKQTEAAIGECVERIQLARKRGSSVMLIYGAHLIKNGAMQIVISLMQQGWIT